MKIAYLHMHSVYSIKDSTAQPIDYVKAIHEYNRNSKEHEIVALAITEHGNAYSTILHHESCVNPIKGDPEKRTLKPLYGNEIYHIEDLEKEEITTYKQFNHLVLIAKNDIGLKNLFKITTHSGLNKCKPGTKKDFQVTDEKFLAQHGEGIIALSACLGGKLPKLIKENKYEEAKAWAIKMSKVFDEFYLELQPHTTIPEQMVVNDALIKIHKETGLPIVLTTDSHYVKKEDKKYHTLMLQLENPKSTGYESENHLYTPEELIDFCNEYNVPLEALENTAKIADLCTADITPKDPKGLMPSYPCPDGHNEDSYLIKLANEGLKRRFEINKDIVEIGDYISRLNYELDIITQMGFSAYFLILWDWFRWCKENKIPLGPGRGSAAGSLVAYTLDITKIDPIKNKLVFERFLNPSRIEEPDKMLI